MGHTPGPWYCDGSEIYLEENVCIAIAYRPRIDDEGNRMPNSQVEANAKLIAAAPELLAVLKRIEHKWRTGGGSFSVGELCREMIAKAEGRSE